jgi:HAD superfamily hydrolase (TIGR01509 family)
MRIKALIFDVDGTLADTEDAHLLAFNHAFEAHELDWRWSECDYAEGLKIAGGKERLAAFIGDLPLPAAERRALAQRIPEIHRTKTMAYGGLIADGRVPLRDGIARLIHEAESAGVRLAIASTTTRENIDALLAVHFGAHASRLFEVIGTGDEAQRKKPAPDIYHFVLGELGESSTDCVALEDSAQGATAAKRAGLFTVVTPSRWTRGEDFGCADLSLSSLASCESPLVELEYAFTNAGAFARANAFAGRWGCRPRSTALGDT